jgi:phospholipid/cholesterol/gamma-HCH transport system substrate-binding protein
MMKVKFNKYERVAGIFVLTAIVGTGVFALSVAVKQGWFEEKIIYSTTFENADGVHPGTLVQMAGLRAGSVEEVDLQNDNKIRVQFYVLGKFKDKIRSDSRTQLIRPFIIGDRVLEISVGQEEQALAENANIQSEETTDLMTLMSGKKLSQSLAQLTGMLSSIQNLAESFLQRDRTDSMIRIFDQLDPFLGNMNTMSKEVIKLSRQATHDENMKNLMFNAALLTQELNKIVPEMNKSNPQAGQQMAQMMANMAELTESMKTMSLAFKDIGPELPGTARRAMEALNEATILMKALQKSFLLKGNVNDVREEEAQRRLPANENKNP